MWVVRGRWRDGWPRITGRVAIPRLEVFSEGIDFVLDTGADRTTIHWADRLLLKMIETGDPLSLDEEFQRQIESVGIGGNAVVYGREQAHALFLDEQGQWLMANDPIDINIALRPDGPDGQGLPSLLGQDLLSRMRVDLNAPDSKLTLRWPSHAAWVYREPDTS